LYGSLSQEDLGTRIRSEFMIDNLDYLSHWLLMFGPNVEVEQPKNWEQKWPKSLKHYSSTTRWQIRPSSYLRTPLTPKGELSTHALKSPWGDLGVGLGRGLRNFLWLRNSFQNFLNYWIQIIHNFSVSEAYHFHIELIKAFSS